MGWLRHQDMLELNASNDLVQEDSRTMDVDENFQAGTDTAPFSPPSRPSTTYPPRKVVLKSDIKQTGKNTIEEVNRRFPLLLQRQLPSRTLPPFIRLTKVLPTELTSSIFSARSIQELYCLALDILNKVCHVPVHPALFSVYLHSCVVLEQ